MTAFLLFALFVIIAFILSIGYLGLVFLFAVVEIFSKKSE